MPGYNAFGLGQLSLEGTAPETTMGGGQLVTLTQQSGVMGPEVPNPNLYALMATPAFLTSVQFQEGAIIRHSEFVAPSRRCTKTPSTIIHSCPTFLSYFSMPFKYWRGSISYQLFFFCSNFTSARFRVTWTPEQGDPVDIDGQQGNIMSKVIEVSGDTHSTITVPYAKPELWTLMSKGNHAHVLADSYGTGMNGNIQIDLMSISSVSSSPVVNLAIYTHAGPDFQVGRYTPDVFNATIISGDRTAIFRSEGSESGSPPSASVWDYATIADPIAIGSGLDVSGYSQSEKYSDLCSLMKRFHRVVPFPNPLIGHDVVLPPKQDNFQDGSRDATVHFLSCFKYWRGGLRVQAMRTVDAANQLTTLATSDAIQLIGNPGTYGLTIRVKMPWYHETPFEIVEATNTYTQTFTYLDAANSLPFFLWAFADDVGVSGLFSPPIFHLEIVPALVTTSPTMT